MYMALKNKISERIINPHDYMYSSSGIDVKSELFKTMVNEITKEIDKQILEELMEKYVKCPIPSVGRFLPKNKI